MTKPRREEFRAVLVNRELETWRAKSACVGLDPNVFFPERGGDVTAPKAVCSTCPVQLPCLDYSLREKEQTGVWGGKSERERRRLRVRYNRTWLLLQADIASSVEVVASLLAENAEHGYRLNPQEQSLSA